MRDKKREKKKIRKQLILRKKEKKMMDEFLLEELMEENQDLEEQYNEVQEIFSKARVHLNAIIEKEH